ncbi:ADP-ribosyltransferase, partial [Streptomonospora algeriensis]
ADAEDFQDKIAGEDDWREDEDKIEELDGLNNDILAAVNDYQRAERDCANAITSLFGGTTFVAADPGDGGSPGPGEQAHGFTEALQGVETPWITPQEHDAEWYEDAWDGVKDFGVGIAQDLGSMTGLYGEDGWGVSSWGEWGTNLKDNWGDTLNGLGSLVGFYGENGWGVSSWGEWGTNLANGWTEFAHAIVPWREWGDRPGYVITQSALNIGSMFVGGAGVYKALVTPNTDALQQIADRPGQVSTRDLQNRLDGLDIDSAKIDGITDSLDEAEGFGDRTTPVGGNGSPVDTDPAVNNGDGGRPQHTGGGGGSGGSGGSNDPSGSGSGNGSGAPHGDADSPSGDRPGGAPQGDADATPNGDADASTGGRGNGSGDQRPETGAPSGEHPGGVPNGGNDGGVPDGAHGDSPGSGESAGSGGGTDTPDGTSGHGPETGGPADPVDLDDLTTAERTARAEALISDGARTFNSDAEATQYGQDYWNDYVENLPADQRESLYNYTTEPPQPHPTYQEMNGQLRRGETLDPAVARDVDKIDEAMAGRPVPEDVVVTRGTGLGHINVRPEKMPDAEEGFTDPGYMSTSLGGPAAAFKDAEAVLHLRVPAGTPALWVEKVSEFGAGERELLLGRGVTYRAVDVVWSNGQWQVYGEVVPE